MANRASKSSIDPALLDQLLAGQDPATVLSSQGLIGDLKKTLAERMLQAEMDVHLDSEAEQASGNPLPLSDWPQSGPLCTSAARSWTDNSDPEGWSPVQLIVVNDHLKLAPPRSFESPPHHAVAPIRARAGTARRSLVGFYSA